MPQSSWLPKEVIRFLPERLTDGQMIVPDLRSQTRISAVTQQRRQTSFYPTTTACTRVSVRAPVQNVVGVGPKRAATAWTSLYTSSIRPFPPVRATPSPPRLAR